MKRTWIIIFCVLLLGTLLLGCAPQNEGVAEKVDRVEAVADDSNDAKKSTSPDFFGYVTAKKANKVLVVSPELEKNGEDSSMREHYDAVWVNVSTDDVKVGHQVAVWFDGVVLFSYPGQATAKEIIVQPSTQPVNSNISEAEAIEKAINQVGNDVFIVVKNANYNDLTATWSIEINDELVEIKG
ncbi:DUF3221 domain-containing protein [Halalkalibacter urbisdiaboli]|uniref:DUF3221 domain-containing protein n=1 Tax=Halalkalibacter urbisdiaboli TaxID=1960589 RepID=UPI0013FDF359|nr:DUF3221 domain-containing protein [Halalkalibacter urbisdiaboli]